MCYFICTFLRNKHCPCASFTLFSSLYCLRENQYANIAFTYLLRFLLLFFFWSCEFKVSLTILRLFDSGRVEIGITGTPRLPSFNTLIPFPPAWAPIDVRPSHQTAVASRRTPGAGAQPKQRGAVPTSASPRATPWPHARRLPSHVQTEPGRAGAVAVHTRTGPMLRLLQRDSMCREAAGHLVNAHKTPDALME